jgi:hypothetical protein
VDGALRRSARRGRDAEALAREVHAELLPEAAR